MVDRSTWPDFNASMQYSYNYNKGKKGVDRWNALQERYNLIKNTNTGAQKIPKVIHQIWLGREMPDFEKRLCKQVKESLGADWEYILWTEDKINKLTEFKNLDLFNLTPNYGQKSDILRYAILHEFGGIYMDTDFLMLGAFDSLLDLDFFCGIAYDDQPNLFNGLIGSSAGNKIIESLLTLDRPLYYHDAMMLMDSTGPFFVTRKLFENLSEVELAVALPNSFFYPHPNFAQCKTLGEDYRLYIKPESVCCHMWSSSWM